MWFLKIFNKALAIIREKGKHGGILDKYVSKPEMRRFNILSIHKILFENKLKDVSKITIKKGVISLFVDCCINFSVY